MASMVPTDDSDGVAPGRLSRYHAQVQNLRNHDRKVHVAPFAVSAVVPVWRFDSPKAKSGSVNAPRPINFSRLLKNDVVISASVLKFDPWGALKIGTAEPPSHARVATATQCVSAILGFTLNGTLNQGLSSGRLRSSSR